MQSNSSILYPRSGFFANPRPFGRSIAAVIFTAAAGRRDGSVFGKTENPRPFGRSIAAVIFAAAAGRRDGSVFGETANPRPFGRSVAAIFLQRKRSFSVSAVIKKERLTLPVSNIFLFACAVSSVFCCAAIAKPFQRDSDQQLCVKFLPLPCESAPEACGFL